MNFDLIIFFVFIASFLGIIFLVFRKIAVLSGLPENLETLPKEKFSLRLTDKIRNIPFLRSFSFDIFLQKILSKIRILSLKTENKTFNLLQKLRKKSQENRFEKEDNYWEEIKKDTKE